MHHCYVLKWVPLVLWCCWLGGRKGIWPIKTECWVLAWLSVWSEVQTCICWCHCHSLSLASVKSILVLPFWYRLARVVLDKGPLNGCVCVCVLCFEVSLFGTEYRVLCWILLRSCRITCWECFNWSLAAFQQQITSLLCGTPWLAQSVL